MCTVINNTNSQRWYYKTTTYQRPHSI